MARGIFVAPLITEPGPLWVFFDTVWRFDTMLGIAGRIGRRDPHIQDHRIATVFGVNPNLLFGNISDIGRNRRALVFAGQDGPEVSIVRKTVSAIAG